MRLNELGKTGMMVSELCLGSMTWGTQNTLKEGHAQIDMALDHGVNFIDTAELYPVNPISAETVGKTESIIGEWFSRNRRRDEVILATKITGENGGSVRGGSPISSGEITKAIEGSLTRLQTDYVDLYQLHWPNRGSYQFRKNWNYDPSGQDRSHTIAHMEDILAELSRLVEAGKIRHVGLSNESAWGTMMWLQIAEQNGWPRMQTMQNEYSMLCRMFDTDMAETCVNENIGLIAFSPLAAGLLTGKYAPDVTPDGSRRSLNSDLGGRVTARVWPAIAAYQAIADKHGYDIGQLALAWCRTRPAMASAIFGATSLDQLKTSLGSVALELSEEVLTEINAAHELHPMPF